MALISDIATVASLAERVGSEREARALLAELEVPVVRDVFSLRLLLARLEGRRESDDHLEKASTRLRGYGLEVVGVDRRHPIVLRLVARRNLCLGSTAVDEPDSVFAPISMARGDELEAELHIASARSANRMVAFGLSRVDQSGPQLIAMYCVEEDRLWLMRRAEAAAIYRAVRDGSSRPRIFSASPREGALRASFAKGTTDFDADAYVTVEPEEH